jgi:hypothetical protein
MRVRDFMVKNPDTIPPDRMVNLSVLPPSQISSDL